MSSASEHPLYNQIEYRRAVVSDLAILSPLVKDFWPVDLADDVDAILQDALQPGEASAVFAAFMPDGTAVGFAQVTLRNEYVEGASGYPVAYLEALFVRESVRAAGVAEKLLQMVKAHAKSLGVTELAADCASRDFQMYELYLTQGFEEYNQVIHFVMPLGAPQTRS